MGYWRNRKRASFARTRYWDRNPDTPFLGAKKKSPHFFLESRAAQKNVLIGVGFEPTPPKRPVPETGALDRSAIQPVVVGQRGLAQNAKQHKKEATHAEDRTRDLLRVKQAS